MRCILRASRLSVGSTYLDETLSLRKISCATHTVNNHATSRGETGRHLLFWSGSHYGSHRMLSTNHRSPTLHTIVRHWKEKHTRKGNQANNIMAKSASDGSSSDEPSSSQASGVSSGSGTGNTAGAESTSDSSFSLARSETRLVNRSKMLVFGVITLAAGLLGCMIFLLLTQEETATFQIEVRRRPFEISDYVTAGTYSLRSHSFLVHQPCGGDHRAPSL
jgi:hypothetical protein